MAVKFHVLIAARPAAYDALHGYLDSSLELIPVHTLNEARRVLEDRHDIDLVLITVNFDESRMFDLLRLCTAKYPDIVVVCCRIFEQDVSKISIEAMRIASEALNAAGFIDVPAISKRGRDSLPAELRKTVFSYLPKQSTDRQGA